VLLHLLQPTPGLIPRPVQQNTPRHPWQANDPDLLGTQAASNCEHDCVQLNLPHMCTAPALQAG
jgi:hypothetical protein